jgi:hypothetical protein
VTQLHSGQPGGAACLALLSRTSIGRLGLAIGPASALEPVAGDATPRQCSFWLQSKTISGHWLDQTGETL